MKLYLPFEVFFISSLGGCMDGQMALDQFRHHLRPTGRTDMSVQ